jgi:hypothetical protein
VVWEDFLVDRVLTGEEISRGVSHAFGVSPHAVLVVPALGPIDLPDGIRILVAAREVSGDFRMYISVVPQWRPLDVGDEFSVVVQLARFWGCLCLVSDDSINPYRWIVVDAQGRRSPVALDVEELDVRERFVLSRE